MPATGVFPDSAREIQGSVMPFAVVKMEGMSPTRVYREFESPKTRTGLELEYVLICALTCWRLEARAVRSEASVLGCVRICLNWVAREAKPGKRG